MLPRASSSQQRTLYAGTAATAQPASTLAVRNRKAGVANVRGMRAEQRFFSTSHKRDASGQTDPYGTLGVKKEASAKEIKTAYYQLAKKFHPDTSKEPGAKERFVDIQAAYDILSDDQKRAAFDQFGSADGPANPDFNPFGGGGSPFGGGGFGGFHAAGSAESIFESLFGGAFGGGGGGGRSTRTGFGGEVRGEDIETSITISFEEACRGTSRAVTISPVDRCTPCTGSGLKPEAKRTTCQVCHGTGTRTFVIQGGFQMASTCPACGGVGTTAAPGDECKTCGGAGRVRSKRTVNVNIPAGVDDGYRIRQDGVGDVPMTGAGPPGSLFVRIHVTPSRVWRRQGTNLFFPAHIPFYTAILGGKVRVPTLSGDVDVRVPAGTQMGEEMVLQGRGVPRLNARKGQDANGDLMVQFDIAIPRYVCDTCPTNRRSLSKHQKELLQAFADEAEGVKRPVSDALKSKAPPKKANAADEGKKTPPKKASGEAEPSEDKEQGAS